MKHETTYLRGARSFVAGRFEPVAREPFDDGWTPEEKEPAELQTSVTEERARSIISRNDSPDIGFSQSINPYRGCEHGCIYCYARPSHAYLELSPGLDFETKLFAKTNAAELLRAELSKPGYAPSPIAIGANTDCYQPIERKFGITRQIVEILAECEHPFTMVTKSALVERDLDLLAPMAKRNLVKVFVSIGSLDRALARKLEPRAASPQRRLDVLKELFKEWLAAHYPERAAHVISIVRQMRGGRDNDPRFGSRMTGTGIFAELIEKRFDIACRRFGLNGHGAGRKPPSLDCSRFRPPSAAGQMPLF